VDDQTKVLSFYTEVLGQGIPMGSDSWVAVFSPQEPEGTELRLEPNGNPSPRCCQQVLSPQTSRWRNSRSTTCIRNRRDRRSHGVVFRSLPTDAGIALIAVFEDTCENLLQIDHRTASAQ
jgi:hypothetical protein